MSISSHSSAAARPSAPSATEEKPSRAALSGGCLSKSALTAAASSRAAAGEAPAAAAADAAAPAAAGAAAPAARAYNLHGLLVCPSDFCRAGGIMIKSRDKDAACTIAAAFELGLNFGVRPRHLLPISAATSDADRAFRVSGDARSQAMGPFLLGARAPGAAARPPAA